MTITLPAAPAWVQTTRPIELGREFSAGFGERIPGGAPTSPVEIVQTEYIDGKSEPAALRRNQPRIYINGVDCTLAQATTLVSLIQTALAAVDPHAE